MLLPVRLECDLERWVCMGVKRNVVVYLKILFGVSLAAAAAYNKDPHY
jgi:hypothetical protein